MNKVFLLSFLAALFLSCNQKTFSIEEETKSVLKIHDAQRGYHFNKDSIAFANQLSKNFISVNKET